MSRSDKNTASTASGQLFVRSSAGVEYRVLDGRGNEVARGSGGRDLILPAGLYSVEWISAGGFTETLVRVPGDGPPVTALFSPEVYGSERTKLTDTAPSLVRRIEAELPSMREYGSAVIVVVDGERSIGDLLSDVHLLNKRDVAMRADQDHMPPLALAGNEAARHYGVPPGTYLLSFRSLSGESMQQSVPALPGRSTLVFLSERNTTVLIANGDGFEPREEFGCDSARTVIVSVAGGEEDLRIRERIRLVRVLLHDIAAGGGSIGADFIEILDDPSSDPLLRLYAAIVTIARLEAKQSPSPDSNWPRGKAAEEFTRAWAERARRWLSIDKGVSTPDETVARWRLGPLLGPDRRLRSQRSLTRPPMLALVWRWAIAHSADDPSALPLSSATLAAARSASTSEPWLCWKASAGKAAFAPATTSSLADVPQMASSISDTLKRFVMADPNGEKSTYAASKALDLLLPLLTPAAANVAAYMVKSFAARKSDQVEDLALAFGMPAGALASRLDRTSQEVDAAIERLSATGSDPVPDTDVETSPSALPIRFPDDPQKGRFGGQSAAGGFVLSAEFAKTKYAGWTRIKLTVKGPAKDGEEVHFYLHDSFRPQKRSTTFRKHRASEEVVSWGGFTVGVWLPGRRCALELDLALIKDAPEPIQTR